MARTTSDSRAPSRARSGVPPHDGQNRSHAPPTSQPHDALMKWVFKQARHAEGLLRALLDPRAAALTDWSSLRVEDGSHVDPELTHRHSDLVLSARMFEQRVYFYTLVEHQRTEEPRMPLRMGHYMLRLWDKLARETDSRSRAASDKGREPSGARGCLPPILPVVLYNGVGPWTAPSAFEDLVSVPTEAVQDFSPHVPRFRLRMVDLSGGRMEGLVESMLTALARAAFWCMSVAFQDERMEREIARIKATLDEVAATSEASVALAALMRYLGATHPAMPASTLRKIVMEALGPEAQEVMVDIFEDIRDRGQREGRQRGLQEGQHEGRVKALTELLLRRYGSLPRGAKARLRDADEATLSRWTLRVLDAARLEDVFEEPAAEKPRRTARAAPRREPATPKAASPSRAPR